jgi:hypothetical protein
MRRIFCIFLFLLPIVSFLNAEEKPRLGFVTNFGYSRSESESGIGIAGGASFRWWRFVSFGMADFTIAPKPGDSRYYMDTFSNGQRRCRDTTNGQFANTELCSGSAKTITAGMFDANIIAAPKIPVMIGAGYRIGPGQGPYVNIGYSSRARNDRFIWFLKGSIGKDIIQAHIGIAVHWPSSGAQ